MITTTDYETEAAELAGYSELALKAQALWCYTHRKDKAAMQAAAVYFANSPKHMARAVGMFPEMFEQDEARTLHEYLSAFKIASLPVHARALLAADWQAHTLSFSEVRERVDALKQRKAKTTLADKVRALIAELDAENENGAGVEVVAYRRMIADKLREMME